MKKITKRKTFTLLSIGLLTMVFSQIISQYVEFNDFMKGSFMGIGIGLLITSLIFGNFKTTHH